MAKDKEEKKKKNKKKKAGEVIRKIAVWLMLIAMVASLFAYAFSVFGN